MGKQRNALRATFFVLIGTALWQTNKSSAIGRSTKNSFDPGQTDVLGYQGFRFAQDGQGVTLNINAINAIRMFLFPNAIKLLNKGLEAEEGKAKSDSGPSVDILDARKATPSPTLSENGFTLINLGGKDDEDKASKSSYQYYEPENWKAQDQVEHFHNTAVVPQLQKMFPNATRFEFLKKSIRGKRTSRPASVDSIHTDVLYDLDAVDKFYDRFGQSDGKEAMYNAMRKSERSKKVRDGVGAEQNEGREEVLDAIVSIWKPIEMKGSVCDRPLAMMDASTFRAHDEYEYRLHLNFWPFMQKDGLGGVPTYRPDQKWYYYPFMTTEEALLFVQYDRNKGFFKVPHTAFVNPNCPSDMETRVSMDYRIMVFSSSTR